MSDGPDYKAFAQWAVRKGVWECGGLESDELQDKAVAFGIVRETKYDPATHGPCEYDTEPGSPWFVFAESASG